MMVLAIYSGGDNRDYADRQDSNESPEKPG